MDERPVHPGVRLKERFLDPLGIDAQRLADAIGLPLAEIEALLLGQTALGPDIAMRLSLFFEVPARWWLEMQAQFDAADQERLEALRPTVRRCEDLDQVLVTPSGVMRFDQAPDASAESFTTTVEVPETFVELLRAQAALAMSQPTRRSASSSTRTARPA